MKKVFSLLIVLLLALALPLSALAMVARSESFYVCDDAGVLSESAEQQIIQLNAALEQRCKGAQLVVVSVAYMDGLYADEYAYSLMNDWGVGSASENNGMLLLFATKENKGWLAVGAGLTGSFDDDTADAYLEEFFWDDYDARNYEDGVLALCSGLSRWYEDYYGVSLSTESRPNGSTGGEVAAPAPVVESGGGMVVNILALIIILAVLYVPILCISLFTTRLRWGRWGVWPFYYFSPWWRMRGAPIFRPGAWNMGRRGPFDNHNDRFPPFGGGGGGFGGFGGSGRGGGFGGGFGGGSGFGGGGHSGGGGGRR